MKVKTALSLPKIAKELIVTVIPYCVIIEIVFWIGLVSFTSNFIELFNRWSANLPTYLYYGPVGHFMFVYELFGYAATCGLFTSYNDCWHWHITSSPNAQIPAEYTVFTLRLISIVLTLVVVFNLFSLPELFARRRLGWSVVLLASISISIILLVSLNIVGFFSLQ